MVRYSIEIGQKEQDILKLKNYCLANRKKAGYKD